VENARIDLMVELARIELRERDNALEELQYAYSTQPEWRRRNTLLAPLSDVIPGIQHILNGICEYQDPERSGKPAEDMLEAWQIVKDQLGELAKAREAMAKLMEIAEIDETGTAHCIDAVSAKISELLKLSGCQTFDELTEQCRMRKADSEYVSTLADILLDKFQIEACPGEHGLEILGEKIDLLLKAIGQPNLDAAIDSAKALRREYVRRSDHDEMAE
jgi:soluble cytochrome b562